MHQTKYRARTFVGVALVVAVSGCIQADDMADDVAEQSSPPMTRPGVAKVDARSPADPPAMPDQKKWRESMSKARPHKGGCFQISYPSTRWEEVPCNTTDHQRPLSPPLQRVEMAAQRIGLEVLGGDGHVDNAAQVSGTLLSANGSFPDVDDVISVSDGHPDQYSLQLNTSFFVTPKCDGAADPSVCRGWQQFLFENDCDNDSYVLMQYWLYNYDQAYCPEGGWEPYSPSPGVVHCNKNSPGPKTVSCQRVSNLRNLSLEGTASPGGPDMVTLEVRDSNNILHLYSVENKTSVLDLGHNWNFAEFNIFANQSHHTATFNSGAIINVGLELDNGTTSAPTCLLDSRTAEKNNLTLVPGSCCASGGPAGQSLTFMETNGSPVAQAPFCLLNDIVPIQLPMQL